MTEPKQQVRGF